MKDKIRDIVITTIGYIIATLWVIMLVAVPTLVACGCIKLIMRMFGV